MAQIKTKRMQVKSNFWKFMLIFPTVNTLQAEVRKQDIIWMHMYVDIKVCNGIFVSKIYVVYMYGYICIMLWRRIFIA